MISHFVKIKNSSISNHSNKVLPIRGTLVCFQTILWIAMFTFAELTCASSYITHYGLEDGLPQTTITSIIEDDLGYLFFGTQDGLARFDGYQFENFKRQKNYPDSLASNYIRSLIKDTKGNVLVGTSRGLNRYSASTNILSRVDNTFSYAISSMAVGADDLVWLGTPGHGLFTTRAPYKKITPVKTPADLPVQITALAWDKTGILWIGTKKGGLLSYISDTPNVNSLSDANVSKASLKKVELKSDSISALMFKPPHTLMVGFAGGKGFAELEILAEQSNVIPESPFLGALQKETVYSFLSDTSGRMWVGGYGESGLFRLNKQKDKIRQFRSSETGNGLSNDKIRSLYEDSSGSVWIGTVAGLSKLDPTKEQFGHVSYGSDIGGLRERVVTAVFEDKNQTLWIGTFGGGLYQYVDSTGLLVEAKLDSYSNDSKYIISLGQAPEGNIWVGTTNGLILFDPHNRKILSFEQSEMFRDELILDMKMDSRQHLWIKTNKHLRKFDPELSRFCSLPDSLQNISYIFPYQKDFWIFPKDRNSDFYQVDLAASDCFSLVMDKINISGLPNFEPMLHDSRGLIWGAAPNGLISVSPSEEKFEIYGEKLGLVSSTIYGVLEDSENNLWISTNGGLSKLRPENGAIEHFTFKDGLQSNEFSGEASVKRANGQLVFAGINGFNLFNPLTINSNLIPPKVYVSSVTIYDNLESSSDIHISGAGQPINNGDRINLTGSQYGFEVEFSALHFLDPLLNRFRFRLEGFEENWNDVGADRRFARYTNLNPGEYTLRIAASNADGIWTKEDALISIVVETPWWMTYWAFIGYLTALIMFISFVIRWRTETVRQKNVFLKNEVKKRTLDIQKQKETIEEQVVELKALDKAKEHFFENISHEFRTPLSLIIGPLKRIQKLKESSSLIDKLDTPIRQASRLLRLINQLLEISRLNSGVLQLNRRTFRLSEQIRNISRNFVDLVEQKNIKLTLNLDDEITLFYDAAAMEKILVNLLSNAINYTEEDGQISIETTEVDHENIIIKVTDTGIGIEKDMQSQIFERFNKARNTGNFKHGLGVGLALVKELVESHGGRISLQSALTKGSCFTVYFPKDSGSREISEFDIIDELSPTILESSIINRTPEIGKTEQAIGIKQWTILIIDDELDMRIYLRELLKNYNILLAENGKQGLELAIDQVPDLIITDVMMPEMDGIELTQAIHKEETTSHIPIIMLTAKGGRHSKLDGLKEGVDDYILKPFDDLELCLRVKNILIIRDELARSFSDSDSLMIAKIPLPENEQIFIRKFRQVLETSYANPEFTLEDMAGGMGLEKRQLQRKLKALLDTSPTEYLRSFRLQKATELLLKGKTVSQTYEMTGFSGISHFSRCFKACYGVVPSQYCQLLHTVPSPKDK